MSWKKIIIFAPVVAVALVFALAKNKGSAIDSKYLIFRCAIVDKNLKLIFRFEKFANFCDFGKNGEVLASVELSKIFQLYNVKNEILWDAKEKVHHWPAFAEDGKSILVKSYVERFVPELGFSHEVVCVSRRTLKNKILTEWCVDQHLEELKKFNLDVIGDFKMMMSRNNLQAGSDMTPMPHLNTFYEIQKNESEKYNPAFAAGNYILSFLHPTRGVLIIDKDMRHILWSWSLSSFQWGGGEYKLDVHDPQVLENGNILMYIDWLRPNYETLVKTHYFDEFLDYRSYSKVLPFNFDHQPFSMIVEVNPIAKKIVRQILDSPKEAIFNKSMGRVRKMRNGNYILNVNNYETAADAPYPLNIYRGGYAVVFDPDGRKLMQIPNPIDKRNGLPDWISEIRPLYDDSFLKARGISD